MIKEFFPDGSLVDDWFHETTKPSLCDLGKQYVLTDYGIRDDGNVYTQQIQAVIDTAAENGGGVVVVPNGTYLTGALFFKQGVNLYVDKDGVLKGSDRIADYPVCETRIEGESCLYYPAIINADNVDGFVICGEGTIDGNGFRSWEAFWLRRKWNPACTNKDEQRPRLVYISNARNVFLADIHLINSPFWTCHIYKCDHVKIIGCTMRSPREPVMAPSTDAIDVDVCTDVLIKGCYIQVNDDAVALKGGKGPWADTLPENGSNERIVIEDCEYACCHSCVTCGSESIHNKNVILRRGKITGWARNILWLKLRPDTPQHYEYVTVEQMEGNVVNVILVKPWRQFYDLKGRTDKPISRANNITMRNIDCTCETFFNVIPAEDQYLLTDFTFADMQIKAQVDGFCADAVNNIAVSNVNVELVEVSQ